MIPVMLRQKDRQAVEEFSQGLNRLLGNQLVRLALFGSKLEGRDTPDSDIDLFILVKDSAWPTRSQILDLAFEVNLKHGVYLSPRVIKESAYTDPVWRETPFLRRLRENSLSVSV